MNVPTVRTRTEIRVANSRFIATIAPAASVAEARAFIAAVRAEMPDATHHVYAYVIGHGATTTAGMSDDGEPSGTAGRPILAVLRGSGLGDTVVVVTRFFGGTLLGTGGLVRAYSDAARAVLEITPCEPKIERRTLTLTMPYHAYATARRLVAAQLGRITAEAFAADVVLTVVAPATQVDTLIAALSEATAGVVRVTGEGGKGDKVTR
jgi:uncharacterized YigZ family protein